jgi:hypothetical protein
MDQVYIRTENHEATMRLHSVVAAGVFEPLFWQLDAFEEPNMRRGR